MPVTQEVGRSRETSDFFSGVIKILISRETTPFHTSKAISFPLA
jgi:hypothetical protein